MKKSRAKIKKCLLGDGSSNIGRFNAHNVDLNRNFPDQYGVNEVRSFKGIRVQLKWFVFSIIELLSLKLKQ